MMSPEKTIKKFHEHTWDYDRGKGIVQNSGDYYIGQKAFYFGKLMAQNPDYYGYRIYQALSEGKKQ